MEVMTSINTSAGFMLDFQTPDEIANKFGIDRAAINRAEVRSINRVSKWFNTQLARMISAEIGVKQSYIKRRLYIRNAQGARTSAALWVGLYDMNLIMLGKGRKTSSGRTVKGRNIKGGFLATMSSGHQGIFKRKGSNRLPIQEEKINISSSASRAVNRLMNRAEIEFSKILKQQLNYEMHKMMKASA